MKLKNTIRIPASDVIDVFADKSKQHVETGDVIIFVNKIIYMRHTATGDGLIRTETGVDITINDKWIKKIEEMVN
jgi:hypothetical protein